MRRMTHTHNRSVTVLNFMSMVAITISRYRLQREGGWVPLLLWIVLFEPPTPPTFPNAEFLYLSFRMRKTIIFVSHTLRYECIIAMCLIAPKAELRCSHLCRKKGGCAFLFVKPCFLVCDLHVFHLRRCFYLGDFYVSRTRAMFKKEFEVCASRDMLRVHFMLCVFWRGRRFLLLGK